MVRYDLNLFEVWKSVPGYEELYEVSSEGRVWSKRSNLLLKQFIDKGGYKTVFLCKYGNRKTCLVHRLVAQAFIENLYNYPQVNHIDENRLNNSVENLEWCTPKYNSNYGGRLMRIHNTKVQNGQITGLTPKEVTDIWRKNHREHLYEYSVKYRNEHRDSLNEYKRQWRQNKKI